MILAITLGTPADGGMVRVRHYINPAAADDLMVVNNRMKQLLHETVQKEELLQNVT